MNYDKACNILKIDTKKPLDVNEVKKKYRIQALKYHPDKCRLENATELFLEVNEAYNYLVNNNKSDTKYTSILEEFLREHLDDFEYAPIILKILNKSFIPYIIENCEPENLKKIYEFLKEYKELFDIEDSIFRSFEKKINMVTIVINPSIDDILESNVFLLNYKGDTLTVPLWHNELYYDIKKTDEILLVKCIPELSGNIIIDSSNNMHIYFDKEIKNELILGKKCFNLEEADMENNKLVLYKKGINSIDEDIFRDNKMDIIVHF